MQDVYAPVATPVKSAEPVPPSSPRTSGDITRLLREWRGGNASALDEMVPHIYGELRELANSCLRRERSTHTLQPTALVNEVYLRLAGRSAPNLDNRKQFYAIAARLMRQILVDHARRHLAVKRGEGVTVLSLDQPLAYTVAQASEFSALDEALDELAKLDQRKARVIELRYFGGLTVEEISGVLGVAEITIHRDVRFATAWLAEQLGL